MPELIFVPAGPAMVQPQAVSIAKGQSCLVRVLIAIARIVARTACCLVTLLLLIVSVVVVVFVDVMVNVVLIVVWFVVGAIVVTLRSIVSSLLIVQCQWINIFVMEERQVRP